MTDQAITTGIEPRRRRFRRRSGGGAPTGAGDSLVVLQAELTLLREENARLQAARYQEPDAGAVLGRLRSVPAAPDAGDDGDEAAAMLVEGLVLRDSLLQVCQELGTALAEVERRLRALDAADMEPTPQVADAA